MHFHLTTILFIILEHINKIFTQGIPISPCPKMFQYRFDGQEWFGILSVRNPDFGQPLHLRVTLSMRGKPTTVSKSEHLRYLLEVIICFICFQEN